MQKGAKKPVKKKKAFSITGEKPVRKRNPKDKPNLHLVSDIGERKAGETILELKKKIQELEQFAYTVSHDLQEPLRKIRVFSELIEEGEDDTETVKRYLDKIKTSAERMTKLIRDVLHYSRHTIERDSFEETDLNEIIGNVLEDFEVLISQTNAEIKYKNLPVIKGIPVQLHQLFSNLIGNALKYCDKNPVIEIMSKSVKGKEVKKIPQLNDQSDYLMLSIKDNGIGFESHYTGKIFNAFHRLHDQSKYQGTGIGLALCKKIVDNHKGYITAESKTGKGSTFIVYMPL